MSHLATVVLRLLIIWSDNITGRGKYAVDRHQLLKFLAEAGRNTTIHTIQLICDDSLGTLQESAGAHHGTYRLITDAEWHR